MENNIENKFEKQKRLVTAIEGNSDEMVVSMLIDLKEQGELFYLNSLLNILAGNRSEMLKKAVVEFISDIKLQEAVPIISGFIESNLQDKDVINIVTASWQSRLDFSQHLDPYFEVLINGNYKIAFEAFTVIENSLENLSVEQLTSRMDIVKKGSTRVDRDKQLLLLEMLSVLDKARRAAL